MKMPSVLQNLLTNKIVLNVVCVLSALNIIGYLTMGKTTAILFYIVLAILITQFNKNMVIVLGVPLILVNLFVSNEYSFVEGMETNSDTTSPTTPTKPSDTSDSKAIPPEQKAALNNALKQDKKSGGVAMTPLEPTTTEEPFEVGRAKRRGAGPQIDYAATVEDAYDNLNSILGGEGIQKLTADSQNLMKQQMQLAKSMSDMKPMIESLEPMMRQAQGMLEGMSGENGAGMQGLMEMAQKMGLGGKKE